MLHQNVINGSGEYLVARDDYHVFEAVDDIKIAVGIHFADIPGVYPPIFQGRGGFFRFVVVSYGEHLGSLDYQFAGFSDRHDLSCIGIDQFYFGIRKRDAHGSRFLQTKSRQAHVHRAGLGHSQNFQQFAFTDHIFKSLDVFGREGGGSADEPLNSRKIKRSEFWLF